MRWASWHNGLVEIIRVEIKNKEEEVNVSRKRHPNSTSALQAAPEHPHEIIN